MCVEICNTYEHVLHVHIRIYRTEYTLYIHIYRTEYMLYISTYIHKLLMNNVYSTHLYTHIYAHIHTHNVI